LGGDGNVVTILPRPHASANVVGRAEASDLPALAASGLWSLSGARMAFLDGSGGWGWWGGRAL